MKKDILASGETKESGNNSSDAFEIIKRKRKTVSKTANSQQEDKKKKAETNNQDQQKSNPIKSQRKDKMDLNKSKLAVKNDTGRSSGVTKCSGLTKTKPITKGAEIPDEQNYEEEITCYTCNICEQTFQNHAQYKSHKLSCTKIPKKFVCVKCSKGFTAKCYLTQHYEFKHTNKPKKYYCKPCNKYFELEKTTKEHNR